MAEWSCSGLQLRVRRFDSDPSLHFRISEVRPPRLARVGEANVVCKALALCEPNDANLRLAAGEIGRLQCDALVSQCVQVGAARTEVFRFARVVKLVDTRDLKSLDHCDRAGSIPAPGTII